MRVGDAKFNFSMSVQMSMQKGSANELDQIKALVFGAAEAEDPTWLSTFGNCSALGKMEDGTTFLIQLEAGEKHSLIEWEDYEIFAKNIADKIYSIIPGEMDYAAIVPIAMMSEIVCKPSH